MEEVVHEEEHKKKQVLSNHVSFLLTKFLVMFQRYDLYLLGSHVLALFRGCRSTCIYSAQVSSSLLPAKFYRSHMTSFLSDCWMYLCVISALCILKTENWVFYQCIKMSLMQHFCLTICYEIAYRALKLNPMDYDKCMFITL